MQRGQTPSLVAPFVPPHASRGPITYGRRYAQTAELYQAHGMEHQLEALMQSEKKAPRRPRPTKAKATSTRAKTHAKSAKGKTRRKRG